MKRLFTWLRSDWLLKVVSLAIAVLIWVFVRVEQKSESVQRVSVRFMNIPEELVLASDPVPEIRVVVEGPRTLIAQISEALPPLPVDLTGAPAGVQQIRVVPDQLDLPHGVEIVRITPSVLEVDLRKTHTYKLTVDPKFTGAPAPGYTVARTTVEPGVIEITAGMGELDGVAALRTEPIDIDGRKTDYSDVVDVDLGDLHVKSLTTREVEVYAQIVPRQMERRLEGVTIAVRAGEHKVRVWPSHVAVTLRGPEVLVKRLDPSSVSTYVEVHNQTGWHGRLPVRVTVPEDATLLAVDPDRVSVTVQQ